MAKTRASMPASEDVRDLCLSLLEEFSYLKDLKNHTFALKLRPV